MRGMASLVVVGWSLASCGCGIVQYSALNLAVAPARVVNQCRNRNEECAAAERAWQQVRDGCSEGQPSKAYAKGFKKGFVEYLDANGNGQPPGAPPLCYRTLPYESPAGHSAIADWYAGYRHGAAAAQDSGIRPWILVPPSDMLANSVVAPFTAGGGPAARPANLPPPRPVPEPMGPPPPPTAAEH